MTIIITNSNAIPRGQCSSTYYCHSQHQDEWLVVTCHNSRRLLVFITGTLTAEYYVNAVLQPVALPFQQDNACPLNTVVSRNCLEDTDSQMLCHDQPHGNCVRIYELHGMDFRKTPLGTYTPSCWDFWHIVLHMHYTLLKDVHLFMCKHLLFLVTFMLLAIPLQLLQSHICYELWFINVLWMCL